LARETRRSVALAALGGGLGRASAILAQGAADLVADRPRAELLDEARGDAAAAAGLAAVVAEREFVEIGAWAAPLPR